MVESHGTLRCATKVEVVEKLEKILQAEDDALHALDDARVAAQRVTDAARQTAAEIRASAAAAAASRAEAVRAAVLERAHLDALSVRQAVADESKAELAAAEARLPGAVTRAVRGLVG